MNYKKLLPFLAAPLILFMCYAIWAGLFTGFRPSVRGENGVWDLRGINFAEINNVFLTGPAEFIHEELLTPQEFEARESEIVVGHVITRYRYSTSRIRLLMPEDGYFTFTRVSAEFASRIYVNGIWLHDVGTPGDSPENESPLTTRIFFTARPENGVIEIVKQVSNFTHRMDATPQYWGVGSYDYLYEALRSMYTAAILMGLYFALFMLFMLLFFLWRGYPPALYFALFCLFWFIRVGVTGSKLFAVLFPWMDGAVMLRLEYIALPVAAVLVSAVIRELFPDVLQKSFIIILTVLSAGWVVFFMVAPTMLMSYTIMYCLGMYVAAIVYAVIRFALKLRKPDKTQIIFLAGAVVYMYGILRDITYYLNHNMDFLVLPPFEGHNFTRVTLLAFVFCQAAAIFIAAMREVENAKMKTEFLQDIKHEVRNPLHIISIGTDFTNQCLDTGGMDDEARNMLRIIQNEAIRLGRMIEGMVELATESDIGQGKNANRQRLNFAEMLKTCAENARLFSEHKGNTLRVEISPDLPFVYAEAEQLNRVPVNILSNAVTGTENGEIVLSAFSDEAYVTVCISDTGEGIAPELLPHVFERGVSGKGGKGFGLSMCKIIVEAHGGTIKIESEQNKGTSVTFTIPVYGGQSEGLKHAQ